jgi:hypothetical protein
MMMNNNILLEETQEVPTYDVMHYTLGNNSANVAARQTALEPSVAGADRAMSWSVWVSPSNAVIETEQRIFASAFTAANTQQYSLSITASNLTDPNTNQKLAFVLFTDGSNFITIRSSGRFTKGRWSNVVITYDGSETAAGLSMYINSVEDASASKFLTGTYTGALNNASLRFMTSWSNPAIVRDYAGDQRDLAIWDIELNQTQVDELYNEGVPFDVNTASFYATNIEAYWPQHTDMTCLNNSSFNFTTVTNIATRNVPVGPQYKSLSIFNAQIGTTSYIAFGRMVNRTGDEYSWYGRRGTDHIVGGDIVKIDLDPTALTSTSAVVVNNETADLRGGTAGVIDGEIMSFTSTWNGTSTLTLDRYESTDGLTGATFGASNAMSFAEQIAVFYGAVVDGPSAGEHFIPWYEFTAGTPLYKSRLFKRDVSGVYTDQDIVSGTNTYTETAITKVNATTYFALMRRNTGGGLFLSISTDNGSTWSAPASTGLGTGVCMADMCLSPEGNVVVIWCDRATDLCYITLGVVANLLIDTTDWGANSVILQGYSIDSLGILGYPTIVRNGSNYAVAISTEKSSTAVDIYFGYGTLFLGF